MNTAMKMEYNCQPTTVSLRPKMAHLNTRLCRHCGITLHQFEIVLCSSCREKKRRFSTPTKPVNIS